MRCRNDPLEFSGGCALVPLAHGWELREGIVAVGRQVERRVKDEFAADQAARIVAR